MPIYPSFELAAARAKSAQSFQVYWTLVGRAPKLLVIGQRHFSSHLVAPRFDQEPKVHIENFKSLEKILLVGHELQLYYPVPRIEGVVYATRLLFRAVRTGWSVPLLDGEGPIIEILEFVFRIRSFCT